VSRTWLADLAIFAAVAVFIAVGPFTPGAWLPSFAAGGVVGAAVVGWRIWQRRGAAPEPEPAAEATDAATGPSRPQAAPVVWVALVALAVLFGPTGAWLYESWTGSIWNNAHGMLIPVVMAWMGYAALRRDPDPDTDESSAWGFAFLVPGLLLVVIDAVVRTYQLAAIGLVIALPGAALLLLGARRTRLIGIPLLLGIFMIPIRNTVGAHLYLKQITATAVEPILSAMGIPVIRQGTLLELPNANFLVADACSGFATLYAAVGIAVVLAAYARTWPRRILLVLSAWPLAVLCNIARVTLLVSIANRFGLGLLDTPFHAASGVFTFWAVLAALIFMADREALREAAT
jgi:exosortase